VALSISFLVYIIVGQYLFGFQLGWFPVQGWSDNFWTNLITYVPLPVLLAVMVGLAPQTRLYRSFFLDELGHDYVRTARAKGLTENTVMFKHVLRNAMIPVITLMGLQFANLITGTIVVENVFVLPGIGRLVFQAISNRDLVVVRDVVMLLAAVVVVVNFLVDVLYALIDPRLRRAGA
jgi:peptide/nickel transport system permease protein